jgi:pimeloyl-ACP methyl ester carboxylesterase
MQTIQHNETMSTSSLYKMREGEQAVMALYEDALKNWPVPCETRMIPTRHGETFVIASGDVFSPVMILLHGAGGNSAMWAGDAANYSRHFRVYAIDLPGEAGKSTINRPEWNGPAFAEWLEDVLNKLEVEQATLVGISQGAWTALKFAVAAPHRVERLVLMAPGGIVPDRLSFIVRAIGFMMLGKWGMKRLVNGLFGDQAVPQEVKDNVLVTLSQFKARIGVLPIFSDEELQRLAMPTLLLGGTKDVMRDLGKIEARLHAHVPHLTVKMIAGGGHALLNTGECVMNFLMQDRATTISLS